MTNEIALTTNVPPDGSGQLVAVNAPGLSLALPDLIGRAGEAVAFRTLEFFTSWTPNPHTRGVYARAVRAVLLGKNASRAAKRYSPHQARRARSSRQTMSAGKIAVRLR
jgi:hypothetical protein